MQVAIKGRAAACQRELGSDQPRGDDSDERVDCCPKRSYSHSHQESFTLDVSI